MVKMFRAAFLITTMLSSGLAYAQPGTVPTAAAPIIPTGAPNSRTLADKFSDVRDAIAWGADPTGVGDSTTALNAALAADTNGVYHNVYLPPGVAAKYHITNSLTLNSGQCLYSDNSSQVVITVGSDYNTSAGAPIIMSGNSFGTPCLEHVLISFAQPVGLVASLTGAVISGTGLTATIASGTPANGNVLNDLTTNVLPNTVLSAVSIVGSALTATVSRSQSVSSEAMTTNLGRTNFATLASGCGTTGVGCQYPPAIDLSLANNAYINDVFINNAWDCIKADWTSTNNGSVYIGATCGALDKGLNITASTGKIDIDHFHFYPWGITPTNNANIYSDGGTFAAVFTNAQGITAPGFFSQNGRLSITGSSFAAWTHLTDPEMDGDNATIEINTTTQWVTIEGGYSTGAATGSNTASQLKISGSPVVLVSAHEFRGSTSSVTPNITIGGGVVDLSANDIVVAGTGNKGIVQTGGTLTMTGNSVQTTSAGAWSVPLISSTSGTYNLSGNTIGLGGGSGTAISGTDSIGNVVADNNFPSGWTFVGPGPNGSYSGTAWTTFTPTVTCGSGTITTYTATGFYQRIGNVVSVRVKVTLTNAGTCAGYLQLTEPISGTSTFESTGVGREDAVTGKVVLAFQQGGTIFLSDYTGATLGTTGYAPDFALSYAVQ